MSEMFQSAGYNSTELILDLGDKFVFTNVTNSLYMFDGWRSTNKLYVKSAMEQDWIITNSGNSNLTIANVLIRL